MAAEIAIFIKINEIHTYTPLFGPSLHINSIEMEHISNFYFGPAWPRPQRDAGPGQEQQYQDGLLLDYLGTLQWRYY